MNAVRNLIGKTAFVTGSTDGIGLSIATELASRGCNIGLNGFSEPERIGKIIDQLQSESRVKVSYCNVDLRNVDAIYNGLAEFARNFERIDILVNNAGIQHVSRVENFPIDKWNEVIAVNLSAVFHCSKAVIPGMINNGWGRIVNIASVHGLVGSVEKSAYVAAKHGVVGLTKVIALENAINNVTCNAVCPGYADTEIIRQQVQRKSVDEAVSAEEITHNLLADKHPSGQFIEPREIASLVAHLCSDEASGMTGAAVSIDGGWSAI